ncbi:hypothetical protein [Vibrio splendidus]|uniref:hypothetical protein n=1 Tax=Vibrio splendidus TaxID=29497 RepID=UPI003D153361
MEVNLASALQMGLDAAKLIEQEKGEITLTIDELNSLIIGQLNEKCKVLKTKEGATNVVLLSITNMFGMQSEIRLFSYDITENGYPVSLYDRTNSEDMCFDKEQLVQGLMDIISTSAFGSLLLEAIKISNEEF